MTVLLAGVFACSAHAAGPPVVGAAWSSGVTASAATLSAEFNPQGQLTNYVFEYLTAASYKANIVAGRDGFSGAATTSGGSVGGSAEVMVEGEARPPMPHTAYVYRFVATNAAAPMGVDGPVRSFVTQELGEFVLPDHRGWELVSPIAKNGGEIQGFESNFGGGVIQASADGSAVTYSSNASFGEAPIGAPPASQYVSARGAAGWATRNISQPTTSGFYGDEPVGVPYQLFSPDLARALMLNGSPCARSASCPRSYALLEPPASAIADSAAAPDLRLSAASPDLRHVVFSSCAALTPGAAEVPEGAGCDRADTNLYEWSGRDLTLVNDPASGVSPPPFGLVAAQGGAVSEEGDRVYWSEVGTGDLWIYEAGQRSKKVPGGAGAEFQAASTDGSLAFFTAGGDLYRYDARSGTSSLISTEVIGVLGASADGNVVYLQNQTGLFRWVGGVSSEIAPGADAAQASDFPPTSGTARVSADGKALAFLSAASLTGYDNIELSSKAPVTEVYLYDYDAANTAGLICASCNPTEERPSGSSSIPGSVSDGVGKAAIDSYKPRDLSDSGTRLFFDSFDGLSPRDAGGEQDVYEWEAGGTGDCSVSSGCVRLISSGRSDADSAFLDASADGSDIFFLTRESLVGTDPGSFDIYDAREGGGYPESPPPFECEGDSCQTLPSEPEDPAVGTDSAQSPGNPPPHIVSIKDKKPRHLRHGIHHRHRKHRHRGHRSKSRKAGKA